jgi:alkylation response protein AidB-like acyl-CoA dehydrogenase
MSAPSTAIPSAVGRVGPMLDSVDAAVAAARALLPEIRSQAARVEAERMVSPKTVAKMAQSGLFGLVTPQVFGGSELGVQALVRVVIEIASGCGSTGWVCGVLSGHSWMLSLFPVAAQEEVASGSAPLVASVFRMGGTITPEGDGYRLTNGQGRFCSGIDHSEWVIIGGTVGSGPQSSQRLFLVPRADVQIIDDWFTVGMRGTGSRSIRVVNAFIPADRSIAFSDLFSGTAPGAAFHAKPIYRMSLTEVMPYSLVGAPLGMARAAVDCFAEELKLALKANAAAPRIDQDAVCLRLARATAAVEAAISVVVSDAAMVDRLADPQRFDGVSRKKLPRNWCWAVQTCREAVNDLYQASGASAIYDHSPIQRIWRDINSAAQHFAFTEDRAMLEYAKTRLGLKVDPFAIAKLTPPKGQELQTEQSGTASSHQH